MDFKKQTELAEHIIKKIKENTNNMVVPSKVTFEIEFENDNHIVSLKKLFTVWIHTSFDSKLQMYNLPYKVGSKISFEAAADMLIRAISQSANILLEENDIHEDGLPPVELFTLLETPYESLSESDFDLLINHYISKEDYSKAQKYQHKKNFYYPKINKK